MSHRFVPAAMVAVLTCALLLSGMAAAPQARAADDSVWYLAEGSTDWGFDTTIQIENTNGTQATAQVTYMTDGGPITRPNIILAPRSQTYLVPEADIGTRDFSTKVTCLEGWPIAVDRTMTWTGGSQRLQEIHSSVGVSAPATRWYLPEGSSAFGFETWLLIQNPNDAAADCTVTYMLEDSEPTIVHKIIPPNSRRTCNIAADIGSQDASMEVECALPVIPERSMYRDARRLGTDSIGTTAPSNDFYLAEGTTAWGFTTYLLIQNPNDVSNTVQVTYMTPAGPVKQAKFTMTANQRKTIRVNDVLPNRDCSIKVHGSAPLISERAMYWGGDTSLGEVAHDSIGVAAAHETWMLPDGDCRELHETWTLVQNPNAYPVSIQVTYLPSGGTHTPVSFFDNIPANSRQSYDMKQRADGPARYAVTVSSRVAGQGIIVERAMYLDRIAGNTVFRTAGSDTIGAWLD